MRFSSASTGSDSTHSATVKIPSERPILQIASTMLRSIGLAATCATNWPSIFRIVHRQRAQVHEGGQAAAEVIQREAAAALLQLLHEVQRIGPVGHGRRFGDLKAQPARHIRRTGMLDDELQEGLVAQGIAGQVDRQHRGGGTGRWARCAAAPVPAGSPSDRWPA